jgi:hypothetical protein
LPKSVFQNSTFDVRTSKSTQGACQTSETRERTVTIPAADPQRYRAHFPRLAIIAHYFFK